MSSAAGSRVPVKFFSRHRSSRWPVSGCMSRITCSSARPARPVGRKVNCRTSVAADAGHRDGDPAAGRDQPAGGRERRAGRSDTVVRVGGRVRPRQVEVDRRGSRLVPPAGDARADSSQRTRADRRTRSPSRSRFRRSPRSSKLPVTKRRPSRSNGRDVLQRADLVVAAGDRPRAAAPGRWRPAVIRCPEQPDQRLRAGDQRLDAFGCVVGRRRDARRGRRGWPRTPS